MRYLCIERCLLATSNCFFHHKASRRWYILFAHRRILATRHGGLAKLRYFVLDFWLVSMQRGHFADIVSKCPDRQHTARQQNSDGLGPTSFRACQ